MRTAEQADGRIVLTPVDPSALTQAESLDGARSINTA